MAELTFEKKRSGPDLKGLPKGLFSSGWINRDTGGKGHARLSLDDDDVQRQRLRLPLLFFHTQQILVQQTTCKENNYEAAKVTKR